MSLPDIRAQGMYTLNLNGYFKGSGPGLKDQKKAMAYGLHMYSGSSSSIESDQYIVLKANGSDGNPSICNIAVAYGPDEKILGVFHREIIVDASDSEEYKLSVKHRYVLPGQLYQGLNAFTPLEQVGQSDAQVELIIKDMALLKKQQLYQSLSFSNNTGEELFSKRKARLDAAETVLINPAESSVESVPLIPHNLSPLFKQCAEFKINTESDALKQSIGKIDKIFADSANLALQQHYADILDPAEVGCYKELFPGGESLWKDLEKSTQAIARLFLKMERGVSHFDNF